MSDIAEMLKKRSFAFALRTIQFCRTLRQTWEGRELSDQLFRAAARTGANYRAACRARSRRDFINKLGHAVEEADESAYWLDLIVAAQIVQQPEAQDLRQEASELSAIFSQSQITAKDNEKRARQERAARRTSSRATSQSSLVRRQS
jgi:four helix bundle protein